MSVRNSNFVLSFLLAALPFLLVADEAPLWSLEPAGGQPLDVAHAFEIPHTAVQDSTAFTVEMKIRCDEPVDGTKLALLSQKTPTTGWGLDLMLWGRVGSPITLRANDASFGCGWFRSKPGEEHVFTITARKGMVVTYWNGKVMKRFFQTIIPNLEPIRVGATDLAGDGNVTEMKGVRLLSLKFYGPAFEYYAPGESRDFAEGYRGGPGWLMSCPTEDPSKKLPRILCYGDSILGGYGTRLRQRLDGKAYVYTWSKFEGGAVGKNLSPAPYLAAEVMAEENVPVLDGYGALLKHLDQACGDGYHWHGPGYERLVDLIVDGIDFH